MRKLTGTVQARERKLSSMLMDTRLETRIQTATLRAIISPLEYARKASEGNKKLMEELEVLQTRAAKDILRCSTRMGSAAV